MKGLPQSWEDEPEPSYSMEDEGGAKRRFFSENEMAGFIRPQSVYS